ncbi:MAG: hypothetical protein V4527_00575 [Pseudomonadota bacterium]
MSEPHWLADWQEPDASPKQRRPKRSKTWAEQWAAKRALMSDEDRLLLHYGVIDIDKQPKKKADPASEDVRGIVDSLLNRSTSEKEKENK